MQIEEKRLLSKFVQIDSRELNNNIIHKQAVIQLDVIRTQSNDRNVTKRSFYLMMLSIEEQVATETIINLINV